MNWQPNIRNDFCSVSNRAFGLTFLLHYISSVPQRNGTLSLNRASLLIDALQSVQTRRWNTYIHVLGGVIFQSWSSYRWHYCSNGLNVPRRETQSDNKRMWLRSAIQAFHSVHPPPLFFFEMLPQFMRWLDCAVERMCCPWRCLTTGAVLC